MMCEFKKNSKKERDALHKLEEDMPETFRVQMTTDPEGFDVYDGIMIRRELEIVEVKMRDISVSDYDTGILELQKVNDLLTLGNKEYPTFPIMYYAFYPKDDLLLIWNILSSHTIERNKMLPRQTSGDRTLVPTDVCHYPIESAIRVELNNNEWGF